MSGRRFSKPRLFLFRGVWHCRLGSREGLGYTAADAYRDWWHVR
jgi:hypothetical protein